MNNVRRLYLEYLVKSFKDPKESVEQNEVFDNNAIIGFSKKNGTNFLSNYYVSTIRFNGKLYSTVEHAYQASKSLDPMIQEMIRRAKTPNDAKRIGRAIDLRQDWDDVKISIMKSLIQEKFENPFLRQQLLETKNKDLINENRWNDTFWGVTNGIGENWLGRIIQEIREEIKKSDE